MNTLESIPSPASTGDLTVTRERSRSDVNNFLKEYHPLSGVVGWKACFGARYRDLLVAVVVLGRPVSMHNDDGTEVSITRFARRPDAPDNTGSFMIARAREWADLEGYETIAAHAGVAGNYGTVYEAAGFEVRSVSQSRVDDWQRREDRSEYEAYERRTWQCELHRVKQYGVD